MLTLTILSGFFMAGTIVATFLNWKINELISKSLAQERAFLEKLQRTTVPTPEAQSRDFIPQMMETRSH